MVSGRKWGIEIGMWEGKPDRMEGLCGEYLLTIDEKNRLLVPSEVRRFFEVESKDGQLRVVIGQNRRPWIYQKSVYDEFVRVEPSELAPHKNQTDFDRMTFSTSAVVELDKQGRILLPEHIRRRTKLDRDVTMIGVRDHLELWNRPEWDAEIESLLTRSAEIVAKKNDRTSPTAGNPVQNSAVQNAVGTSL